MDKGSTSDTGTKNSKKAYPVIIESEASKSDDFSKESKKSSKKSQAIKGNK